MSNYSQTSILISSVRFSITTMSNSFISLTYLSLLDKIFWLVLWSAIEPGLGITACSLATLRPLFRACSRAITTWRSTGDKSRYSTYERHSGDLSPTVERGQNQDGALSILEETVDSNTKVNRDQTMDDDMDNNKSFSSIFVSKKGESIGQKIKKASWWRPPEFAAGLRTEFRRATRDIQLEEINTRTIRSTQKDIETASEVQLTENG
jgi:hypothetical protein